jgi:hypothetical protein
MKGLWGKIEIKCDCFEYWIDECFLNQSSAFEDKFTKLCDCQYISGTNLKKFLTKGMYFKTIYSR